LTREGIKLGNSVLITGGAGYLGSVMTEVMLSKGYKVTVLDNLTYKQLSLSTFCHNPNFRFVLGDVRDAQLLSDLVETHDIIIPLAAIVGMPACKKDPDLTVAVNYEQIRNIVEFARFGQKILVPNTNSQYGSSDTIITEESPFNPLSLYAKTKCDAEKAILDSGNGISLRLATVFGVSYRQRMDLLVNDFVYRAFTDEFLVLFESHFLRNYVHVRDVAKAFIHLIENYDTCNNNAFNVGLTSANMSKLDLAKTIKNHVPGLVIVEEQFKEDFDKRNYVVSNEKLEKTGWFCDFTIDLGIQELLQAYKMIHNFKNREFTNL
jgi:nucleoside-diphosphate-sugar epimerase